MKWKNRGHEYDEIGNKMKGKSIYIYGAGIIGRDLYYQIEFIDAVDGFIDRNQDLQNKGMCGKPVLSIDEFVKKGRDKSIVIIALNGYNAMMVHSQLNHLGYTDGENCFFYDTFLNYYFPIYALYCKNVLYFPSISFLLTTHCNLNCIGCLNFTKYNSNKKHYELYELKKNVDAFFSAVDYVDKFHISGGEPFLYPHYEELLCYVGDKYGSRIRNIYTATNGTIMPRETLVELLKKYNVFVEIDDYRKTLNKSKIKNDLIIDYFQREGIRYSDRNAEYWIDLSPEYQDNSWMNEEELGIWYDTCNNPFASIHRGFLYSCNYDDYAKEAELVSKNDLDVLNLNESEKLSKEEILEFRLGYTTRGFVCFCKKCAGHEMTNKKHIPVAEQW